MTCWAGNRALEVLTLDLEGEAFAIEAACVREILDLVPVTEVPNSDPFVSGLINVRGKVVPLADLRIRFGMEQRATTVDTRIVVLELNLDGEAVTVGICADRVHEVTQVAAVDLQETPRVGTRWRPEFIRCIGRNGSDFMVVLDIVRVFSAGLQISLLDYRDVVPVQPSH
jgi:purine-binding chemotaxis protein CheW